MIFAVYGLAFASVLLIFMGLAARVRTIAEQTGEAVLASNALTDSPVGFLIRPVSVLNRRESLEPYRARIEAKLVEAGQPGGAVSGYDFLASAQLAGVGVFLVIFVMFSLAAGGVGPFTTIFSLALGAGVTWLGHAWLDGEVAARRKAIARQLPFFLDLAVMCMEAGASFQETVEIYERDNPDDALAEELRITMNEVRMGKTLIEALEALVARIQVDTLHNVMNALIQASQMGTALGQTLREQADTMRFKRSQDAERMGEELKVKIQGPVILMMIAVFLLILGPAFLETLGSGIL